jgi:3-oxoacyl-[acyl-carrier-protein] synthase-3
MLSTGLSRIGTYVPPGRESVQQLMIDHGRPWPEIRRHQRVFDLWEVPVASSDQRLEDLLVCAVTDLAAKESLARIGLVLYAHSALPQVPPGYPLLRRVLAPFGLATVPSTGVAHVNCAAGLRAVQLAGGFLAANPDRAALVLIGDHTSILRQTRLVPGVSVTGDAAVAFLVQPDGYRYRRLAAAWRQDVRFHRSLQMSQQELATFTDSYRTLLAEVLTDCARSAGLTLDDVDHLLPHNVNATTWRRFAQQTGFPRERIFLDLVPQLGHTMATDAFLNLAAAERNGRLAIGDKCLLVSVGYGSYFGADLVEVCEAGPPC